MVVGGRERSEKDSWTGVSKVWTGNPVKLGMSKEGDSLRNDNGMDNSSWSIPLFH